MSGNWPRVRGNKAHVSDITLDHPIKAQDWRLHVITADNGTPWQNHPDLQLEDV